MRMKILLASLDDTSHSATPQLVACRPSQALSSLVAWALGLFADQSKQTGRAPLLTGLFAAIERMNVSWFEKSSCAHRTRGVCHFEEPTTAVSNSGFDQRFRKSQPN